MSNKHSLSDEYNLQVIFPDIAKQWHPTKNQNQLPSQFTPYSRKVIWWQCPKSDLHVWKTSIGNRTAKEATGCPFCSGRYPVKGESLGDLFPILAKELDIEKNNKLDPFSLPCRTSRKVWWKCEIGHSWRSAIAERTKDNPRTCPKCQSFGCKFPDLANLWHPTKNKKTPFDYKPFSHVEVWWICGVEGHTSYKRTIHSKSSGQRCPRCAGNLPSDKNNLFYKYPDLCKEWDFYKNKKQPNEYTPHSNKKVWWVCQKNPEHKWEATIVNRTRAESGCPHCNNTQTSKIEVRIYCELKKIFSNTKWRHSHYSKHDKKKYECDLFFPTENIAIEIDGAYWHKDKIKKDLNKTKVLSQDGITLLRLREQPLEKLSEDDVIYKNYDRKLDIVRSLASKLITMVSDENLIRLLEQYSKATRFINDGEYKKIISYLPRPIPEESLMHTHPKLAKEWDYDKNYPLTPSMMTYGMTKKVYWKCINGHIWPAAIGSRAIHNRGCRKCHLDRISIGYKKVSEDKSLAKLHPVVTQDWSSDNKPSPFEVSPNSKLEVKWECKNGHIRVMSIYNRVKLKNGCVKCSKSIKPLGYKKVDKLNSLGVLNKELLKEWSKNNPMSPYEISSGSNYKAEWVCKKCGYIWSAILGNRALKQSGCPKCN